MSIGRDIALAREGLRVQAESLMRSAATVDRPTGRTTDPDTGAVVQSYEPRPPIVCHLLRTSTTDRTVVAGGADIAEAADRLSVPITASLAVGDRVTITASEDQPASVGMVLRVTALDPAAIVRQKLPVEAWQ